MADDGSAPAAGGPVSGRFVVSVIAGEPTVDDLEREDVRIAASHRIGAVGVGEPALVACVASAHRSLAFEVSRELIERIKAELPIWKRQVVSDGRHNWQGLK